MTMLYPHQARVSELILAGKNVLLAAPTGSGKTLAALHPFLLSLDSQSLETDRLPEKCIYSVPMRVLANQFKHEYDKDVAEFGRRINRPDIRVRIQTGEHADDRELTSHLIFATIDQTLSSYLLSPYSLSRRSGNLNAGALIGSYLVFDEFHLYDPESTLPTALHMLQRLKGITPFVLMTATFTDSLLDELAELLDCVVVPGSAAERQALLTIKSQQKTRRYSVARQPLSADAILERHTGKTLVICNQVERAQKLAAELQQSKRERTNLVLLHSQFLPEDRRRIETTIHAAFEPTDADVIVISTQAIEVGVDISSTVLHTELSPANSIIQRAGRCARRQGDEGEVIIYTKVRVDDTELSLMDDIMPYQGMGDVIARTLDAFRERTESAMHFTYLDEQAVLNEAHAKRDEVLIHQLRAGRHDHQKKILAVQNGTPSDDARHLVRNIVSQPVIISSDPDALLQQDVFNIPAFNLHPGTLQKHIRAWLDRADEIDELPFSVKYLHEHDDHKSLEAADQQNQDRYSWQIIPHNHPKVAWGAKLIVVHPLLATYDEERGFIPHRTDEPLWESKPLTRRESGDEKPPHIRVRYRLETYPRHIRLVHNAFQELWDSPTATTARRVERFFGWERDTLKRACQIAVLLHDVGKLNVKWQKWVAEYQAKIEGKHDPVTVYAHTDYERGSEEHEAAQRQLGARPYHAVEGAMAVLPILQATFEDDDLVRAVFSAIARHHAPFSGESRAIRLIPNAQKWIAETADAIGVPLDLSPLDGVTAPLHAVDDAARSGVITVPDESDTRAFFAYLILVRMLRRADQQGTKKGSQ